MTAYYVVNFGDPAVARDFVNVIASLGRRSAAADSKVRITEDIIASLRQKSRGADGAVRDFTVRDLTGHGESSIPCVRMGGYAYPVRPESAALKTATRLAVGRP